MKGELSGSQRNWQNPFPQDSNKDKNSLLCRPVSICSIQYLTLLLEFWKAVLSIEITSILCFPQILSHVLCFPEWIKKHFATSSCKLTFKLIPNRFRVSLDYDHRRHQTCLMKLPMLCKLLDQKSKWLLILLLNLRLTALLSFVLHFATSWAHQRKQKTSNCNSLKYMRLLIWLVVNLFPQFESVLSMTVTGD